MKVIKEPSISSDSEEENQAHGKTSHVPKLQIKYSEPAEKIAPKEVKLGALNGMPRGNKTFSSDDSGANNSVRYAQVSHDVDKPLERINIDN